MAAPPRLPTGPRPRAPPAGAVRPASIPSRNPGAPPAPVQPSRPGAPLASVPPGHPGAPPAALPPGYQRAPPAAPAPPDQPGAPSAPKSLPVGTAPPGRPVAPLYAAPMLPAEPLPPAAAQLPPAAAPPLAAAPLPPPPQPVAFAEQAQLAAQKQYTSQTAGQMPGTCAVATVKGSPSELYKREYVTAVKTYEQQIGANIVRGKMFIESSPANSSVPPHGMLLGMTKGMVPPGGEYGYFSAAGYGGPTTGFSGAPPMIVGSGFNMSTPGGYNGLVMPPYGVAIPGMASTYSAERFQEGYGRPDIDSRVSGSAEWPRDAPREYGRQTMSRENTGPLRDDYTEDSRLPPKHSLSRASDLLQKIKDDLGEHSAETLLGKIRRDVMVMDADDNVGRAATARSSNLPPARSQTSSRTLQRPYDDQNNEERRSSRQRRRTSRHHKSSSSSSSSHGKPYKKRSHKSKDIKGKRHKSRGKRRGASSLSSSSSSSGRRSPLNKGCKSIEFVRQVTERFSLEPPTDGHPATVINKRQQKYKLIAQPGSRVAMNEPGVHRSGSTVFNAMRVDSREKAAIQTQSRAFEGSGVKYDTDRQPLREKAVMRTQPKVLDGSVFKYGTDRQPSSVSVGGALYRYESHPTSLKRE